MAKVSDSGEGYKLLGETEDSYHVAHPDGTDFAVAKEGLDDATHSKILSMNDIHEDPSFKVQARNNFGEEPNLADPRYQAFEESWARSRQGMQEMDANKASAQAIKDATARTEALAHNQKRAALGLGAVPVPGAPTLNAPMSNMPAPASTEAGVSFMPQQAPQPATTVDPMAQAYAREKAGIQAEANALSAQGVATSQAEQDFQKQAQNAQSVFDKQISEVNERRATLTKAINDNQIDPDHYWHSRSAGQKMSAIIGVFLGGAGGDTNQALALIQNNIKHDIDSQIQNLGKQKTLLESNLRESGEIGSAYAKTMDTYLTITRSKIAQAAANAQGPIARSRAEQMLGGLDKQMADNAQKMALYKAELAANSGAVHDSMYPAQFRANEKMSATDVMVGDNHYQARTPKEAEEVRKFQTVLEPIKQDLKTLKSLGVSALGGGPEAGRAKQLVANLIPKLNESKGLTRLTAEDIHLLEQTFSNPNKLRTWLEGNSTRTDQLLQSMDEDAEAKYKTILKGYKGSVASKGSKGHI